MQVVVLSRVRHPNLVMLMGSCSEASGLVYEFLPNGSLEDRLACENSTPPLTWQVRTRIIGEICSALVFLHSTKPHPVIHGDLKPSNILLDANLVSKLSDFVISCLLVKSSTMSTSLYQTTNPRGTYVLRQCTHLHASYVLFLRYVLCPFIELLTLVLHFTRIRKSRYRVVYLLWLSWAKTLNSFWECHPPSR